MNQDNFDNAFLLLVVFTLGMLTITFNRDITTLKSATPAVITVSKPEYIYMECRSCIVPTVEESTVEVDRVSRGDYVEYIEPVEEVIEEVVYEPLIEPNIQSIDDNFDVMMPSNFTVDDICEALSTESHQGLLPLANVFVEAEDIYGINALYLMSTIGWESGWGKHRSNANNIAGWKDPSTGGWRYFNSEYECIMTVAAEVSTLWVDSVGSSLGNITSRYCPSPGYGENIKLIMSERQNKILN